MSPRDVPITHFDAQPMTDDDDEEQEDQEVANLLQAAFQAATQAEREAALSQLLGVPVRIIGEGTFGHVAAEPAEANDR